MITAKKSDAAAQSLANNDTIRHYALQKYEAILNNASVGISFTRDNIFRHANPAFEEMFGWPPGGLAGQPWSVVWGAEDEFAEIDQVAGPLLGQGKPIDLECMMRRRDGSLFWVRIQGRPIDPLDPIASGAIWIIEDITERRNAVERLRHLNEDLEHRVRQRTEELAAANSKLKLEVEVRLHAEERARHLALHDALTGLPNRRLLEDRLIQLLAQAHRDQRSVAIMFIDLDRFKAINDSLGHAAGDEVLREMAARLKSTLRDSDTVARIGGDEFVLIVGAIQSPAAIPAIAEKLMAQLNLPCFAGGQEFHVTSSIGISLFPNDGDDPQKLLSYADAAMYNAKSAGRRGYQLYNSSMGDAVSTRLKLENDLHLALERGELVLHYQPRVDLGSRGVCGYEGLLRWNHPQNGLIVPAAFIPIAEDNGLIVPIGAWVIGQACQVLQRWRSEGRVALPISVNLSARQFFDGSLPSMVAATLAQTGVPPALLELEITETTLMENTDATMSQFAELKRLGVKISIDDFGTGFSSLAYLKRFRVDNLKIDQSFVRDINTDPDDAAIVLAIIGLAKTLQFRVIAEGVETREQFEFLAACRCDQAQGFYLGEARAAEEIEAPLVAC